MVHFLRDIVRITIPAITAAIVATAHTAPRAQTIEPYQPEIGQAGKDVIWVPTPPKAVERMLMMAKVGPADFLIDLGAGDGRIVIAAAKQFGARGFGVDLNSDMVKLSEYRALQAGVADRAKFFVRDIFATDLSQASVITLYLLPELNIKLRPTLLRLAPGTRIVANAFDMGEWEADQFDNSTASSLRLWIVPARLAGAWAWSLTHDGRSRRFELDMNQQYQRISGVVKLDQQRLRLRDPRLRGDQVQFTLLEQQRADYGLRYDFSGRAKGNVIEGEVHISDGDRRVKWTAARHAADNSIGKPK